MLLGKKVAIFDVEWGRSSAPREGLKIHCTNVSAGLHQSGWQFSFSNFQP